MQESNEKMTVITPGHVYDLHNVESGVQTITFIQKEVNDDKLETVQDGTTNEALLQVLIDRLNFLNEKTPSDFNVTAINGVTNALEALQARTADRVERDVEGTNQE